MASSEVLAEVSAKRPSRWVVVALLTIAVVIAYANRINLSTALPEIRKSFPLSLETSGILLSSFFWAYTLLQVPAGWAVDRFGMKWLYAVAFLFWSLISAATALANSVETLITLRVLLGIGEAFVTPASMRYIRKNFAEKERGLPIGIFMSGTKYGPAIGAPLTTYLVLAYGWRQMFVLSGALCIFWLIPWIFFVKNDAKTGPVATKAASEQQISWRSLLSSPVIWGSCLATFCYMYFVYFCMTWMPTYYKDKYGLSLTKSGWFTFMSFVGMATIAILAGWAADRLIANGRNPVTVRKAFTIVGFVLAFSVILGALPGSASMTLFWSVFSLTGLGLATANYWALTQTLTPSTASARVAGLQNTAANLAGIAAPWITGILVQKTKSFNTPLMAIGFWLVVGVSCYLFLVREKYALR
jgi:ACS family D-galactonate transporter-like MFS transporter